MEIFESNGFKTVYFAKGVHCKGKIILSYEVYPSSSWKVREAKVDLI